MNEHVAFIGIGTNLGDRVNNMYAALDHMSHFAKIRRTSFLYETPPAYITDQPAFLNAVCQIATVLSPKELLAALETIMAQMGRIREVRYGPRAIDLDILFFEELIYSSEATYVQDDVERPLLTIPHPLITERSFVLGPLHDIAPALIHPSLGQSIRQLWQSLPEADRRGLTQVTPVDDQLWRWGQKTYVMGIVNVTPDSFSGDGLAMNDNYNDDYIEQAVTQAERFAAEGADCLDVGGQSTRPGHDLVTADEEIHRVVPIIKALRQTVDLPISIDTFRAEVAEAALLAGAKIVNDVWGLSFQQKIGTIAAEHHAPLIIMHNRMATGYVEQLEIPPGLAYEYENVVEEIRQELVHRFELAQDLGVVRWNLISDPGIGFGKTQAQQLWLINQLDQLRALHYPLLFGASRKGFIGRILGDLPPAERVEGTLAANVIAIARGADIIRVHDVKEATRAAQIADAIVRNS